MTHESQRDSTRIASNRRNFLRLAGGGLATAAVLGSADPVSAYNYTMGPVLYADEALIERAHDRVYDNGQGNTFWEAWDNTYDRARSNASTNPNPYQGYDYETYWNRGKSDSSIALDHAFVYAVTQWNEYGDYARDFLLAWANDYHNGNTNPASENLTDKGQAIARVMSRFCYVFTLIWEHLTASERDTIEDWMYGLHYDIRESHDDWIANNYYSQPYQNHLAAHDLGFAAIGYATGNRDLVTYAVGTEGNTSNPKRWLQLIEGAIVDERSDLQENDPTLTSGYPDPRPGEIYDRYRVQSGHGLDYSLITLRHMTLVAEAARRNDEGWYLYAWDNGDGLSLDDAWAWYGQFLQTGDPCARTGYYCDDGDVPARDRPMYEVAHSKYTRNSEIAATVGSGSTRYDTFDDETFNYTAVVTHGHGHSH